MLFLAEMKSALLVVCIAIALIAISDSKAISESKEIENDGTEVKRARLGEKMRLVKKEDDVKKVNKRCFVTNCPKGGR